MAQTTSDPVFSDSFSLLIHLKTLTHTHAYFHDNILQPNNNTKYIAISRVSCVDCNTANSSWASCEKTARSSSLCCCC